jgi:pimeloyl-ACP methyl ester carboxylesterase
MPKDQYIQIGQIKTRFWAEGIEGSALVLIHGIGRFIEDWLPSFYVLAERHRVYAVDLLGHGRTDKPLNASYKIVDLAQFVKDFMTALGIEHAHIIGHSLGGAVSTRLTLLYPNLVDKLNLVSSAGLGRKVTIMLRIATIPILGEKLTRPSRSGAANSAKTTMHNPDFMTDELIELDYQMASLPGAQQSLLRVLRANGNFFGQRKSMYKPIILGLPSITKPVQVIWGRQDQIVPVEHADVAAKNIPDAKVRIFDNCGHFPMLEHTQIFNELLLEFSNN